MDLSKLRKYAESPLSKVVDNKIFLGENTDRSDITTVVNETYKTIDNLAMYAREKTDSFISQLMQVSVDELCDFNIKNGIFMYRLMDINAKEKEITLNALGTNVPLYGNSHANGVPVLSPSYAEEFNYQETFVKKLASNEGSDSSGRTQGATNETYLNPYGEVINYYPDDNGTWETDGKDGNTPTSKWDAKNRNSALYKTKKLFNDNKINTIISRFHTDANTPKNDLDVRTKYGLSHGRNLLTKQAEDGQNTYKSNGYDNPYCRVWTHHHQYDRLDKLIRPFVTKDENGESKPVGLMDFHNWQNFKMVNRESETGNDDNEKANDWGWKYNNDAWKYSVLQDNGFVNITPKYVNGGATNIHTKQCMFSIENLAWRDFDPYSFEKALSWEQRGPMGGRIMWFPPYGISFNETTQTNWNGSTFIGRGEDVYTYINTKRSGTLNFMLVVDHPSINDYVSFYEANHVNVHDTDLLRFQAGCDVLKSGSAETPTNSDKNNENDSNNSNKQSSYEGMLNYAQPTPLTDEYIEKVKSVKEDVEKKEKPQEPESTPDDVVTITFFVFYPNNYSGYYDRQNDSIVEPIAYLLFGDGAQMKEDINNSKRTTSKILNFNNDKNIGRGYEMGGNIGISLYPYDESNGRNYIINQRTNYNNILWCYRIDGNYDIEGNDVTNIKNCYNQLLYKPGKNVVDEKPDYNENNNYFDNISYGYNTNAHKVAEKMNIISNEKDIFCSLSEIAYALTNKEIIKINANGTIRDEIVTKIKNIIDDKEIFLKKINAVGYSNSHGDNSSKSVNTQRNIFLAKERANTPVEWLKDLLDVSSLGDNDISINYESSIGENIEYHNDNGENAKLWRSAKVELTFSCSQTKLLSDANTQPNLANVNAEDVINQLINRIQKKWGYFYETNSEIEALDELIKNVNTEANEVLDELYSGVEQLDNIKSIFKENNIENALVINTHLIEFDYKYNTDNVKDEFLEIRKEILEKDIKNGILDCKDLNGNRSIKSFSNQEEFDNVLGKLIKEDVEKNNEISKLIKQNQTNLNDIIKNRDILNNTLDNFEEKIENFSKEKKTFKNVNSFIAKYKDFPTIHTNNDVYDETIEKYSNEIQIKEEKLKEINFIKNENCSELERENLLIKYNLKNKDLEYEIKKVEDDLELIKKEYIKRVYEKINDYEKQKQILENTSKQYFDDFEKLSNDVNNVIVNILNYTQIENKNEYIKITIKNEKPANEIFIGSISFVYDYNIVDGNGENKVPKENVSILIEDVENIKKEFIAIKEQVEKLIEKSEILNDNSNIKENYELEDLTKLLEKYIENNNIVDKHYIEELSEKLSKVIYNEMNITISVDDSNSIQLKFDFKEIYKEYNEIITSLSDSDDVVLNINNNDLKQVLTNVNFPTFDKTHYMIFDETEKYGDDIKFGLLKWQEWHDDVLTSLLNEIKNVLDLNNESTEWVRFFETLDKTLKTTISGYECIKNDEKIKSISENINAQLEDYRNALNNSEFKEGFVKHSDGIHYVKAYESDPELRGRLWVYDEKTQQMVLEYIDGVDNRSRYKDDKDEKDGKFLGNDWSNEGANRLNKYRYDQEYHFFKILKQKDPIVFDSLMQKLQYFNPAYHSMTPEGFSTRLTFLQQCTRQGDTSTATDRDPKSANNLAFGRPPFCVLRLGDFYNQMIVIDNISINYDPLVWDLNTEGIGVIPLIANVSISFTFIGGGSMYGPVQRLQNAMSFNYYANSNLYDNRSDSPRYNWDVKTNGALDHSLQENSYFHTVQTYNKNK